MEGKRTFLGKCGPGTFHLLASICTKVGCQGLVGKLGVFFQGDVKFTNGHLLEKCS